MRPRERMCPLRSTNPGCERPQGSGCFLSTPSGQMAGVGQGDCGGPHAHRGLRHSQQGSWRPTEQGARGARLGGLRGPLPVRTASKKGRFRRSRRLSITRRTPYPPPSRIILERINYEIVN